MELPYMKWKGAEKNGKKRGKQTEGDEKEQHGRKEGSKDERLRK
jgi:hypothetical protein